MPVSRRRACRLAMAVAAIVALLSVPVPASAVATVTVAPTAVVPGGRFTIVAGCGAGATWASVSATTFGGPSRIPLDRYAGGGPGAYSSVLTVPAETLPGSYLLDVTCGDGSTGAGALVVSPHGAPAHGDGATADGVDLSLLATGALLVLVAGGAVTVLRRRPSHR
jgi:hypothetical protein